jgi:hypothetical protein
VESNRHHRGVVHAIEVLPNRLIEVPHEMCLVQCREIFLHQLLKLDAQGLHGGSVPAHICKGYTRDDAARTEGDIVHVATAAAGPKDHGMDPHPQARQLCHTRTALIAGPGFSAFQTV